MISISPPLRAFILFGALFCVDRFSKIVALFLFSEYPTVVIPNVLQFSLYLHTKFFSVDPALLTLIGFVLVGLFFIAALTFHSDKKSGAVCWMALIAVGAASNLLDVLRYGSVIDWIEIPRLTFFNLSDGFIIGGCIGLLLPRFYKRM